MASQQITEEAVYLCTGNPLPKDIEQISYWLLNESFTESFKRIHHTPSFFFNILLSLKLATFLYKFLFPRPLIYLFLCLTLIGISEMKTRKGLALVDIVREVTM